MDSIVVSTGVAVGSAVLVTIVLSFFYTKKTSAAARRIAELEANANEHQKEIHRLEATHLKARNDVDLEHHNLAKHAREKYFNEGIEHGLASSQKDHLIEITNLRAESPRLL